MTLSARISHPLRSFALDVDLAVGQEILGLVGPSGAGKTSVLRAIAGLLRPQSGRIELDGRVLFDAERRTDLPPERRGVGLVFQEGALFPHLSVYENVAYGLRGRIRRSDIPLRVHPVLERFGIVHLAGARPPSISGGERRRVALARAVAAEPEILLLDEPLSALDPKTKGSVSAELASHLQQLSLPAVLVSHDFADIVGLSDRIAVMEEGRIVQLGTAAELVQAPASPFVAAFTGVNYFAGTATRQQNLTEIRTDGATLVSTDDAEGPVGAVVPPWDVSLSTARPEGSALNALSGPVTRIVTVGNRVRVTLASRPQIVAEITEDSAHRLGIVPGLNLVATWKATGTRLVPARPINPATIDG